MIILVTGFGAFPGARSNPSAALLGRLSRQRARLGRLGITIETALLPVVFDAIGPAMRARVAASRPDAILHLGLAARRRAVSVETRALNRTSPLHLDAAGRRASRTVAPGAPMVLRASCPVARVAAAARASGVPARPSIDAGDYVCNALLYLTLVERLAPTAGFIHVPRARNPAQPRRRVRRARPSLDDLARATLAAILVMARGSA